jgi:hypothetical protein
MVLTLMVAIQVSETYLTTYMWYKVEHGVPSESTNSKSDKKL